LKLCTLLGRPELAKEERFKDNQSRVDNREELGRILNECFAEKTTDDWMKLFDGTGLPYGPINTMERVFNHPQTEAREMVHEIPYEHATSGKLALLGEIYSAKLSHSETDACTGPAVKLSDTKPTIRRRPPLYGEHTSEVLQEYGISSTELETLKQEGVI
jgi:succinate---hydroxymethylglutarate CoA-transferase